MQVTVATPEGRSSSLGLPPALHGPSGPVLSGPPVPCQQGPSWVTITLVFLAEKKMISSASAAGAQQIYSQGSPFPPGHSGKAFRYVGKGFRADLGLRTQLCRVHMPGSPRSGQGSWSAGCGEGRGWSLAMVVGAAPGTANKGSGVTSFPGS